MWLKLGTVDVMSLMIDHLALKRTVLSLCHSRIQSTRPCQVAPLRSVGIGEILSISLSAVPYNSIRSEPVYHY